MKPIIKNNSIAYIYTVCNYQFAHRKISLNFNSFLMGSFLKDRAGSTLGHIKFLLKNIIYKYAFLLNYIKNFFFNFAKKLKI